MILQGIWEFLYKNKSNYNSYKFSYEFAFISFLSFRRNKQEPKFQQVNGLVEKNISVFYLQRVALDFQGMSNSIDFYKDFRTWCSCSYYSSMMYHVIINFHTDHC